MKTLLIISLILFNSSVFPKGSPTKEVSRLEQDIFKGKLPDRATAALDILFKRAAKELTKKGYKLEADRMESEWRTQHRRTFYTYATSSLRDIGDHKALSQWLADKYEMLELVLGIDICRGMHFTAIKIFNFTPPVVFRPSSFEMDNVGGERVDEYRRHFAEGKYYYGLVPEVSYWAIWGACAYATMGGGAITAICGIAGELGEKMVALFVAPKLSDWVFNRANGVLISGGSDWDYWEDGE